MGNQPAAFQLHINHKLIPNVSQKVVVSFIYIQRKDGVYFMSTKKLLTLALGSGESGIELSASADGTAKKYEAIQSTVEILTGITEKITQFMAPEKGGILLSAAATPILKRHRLLNEMDADTLLTYDDMALEDIDYIIL